MYQHYLPILICYIINFWNYFGDSYLDYIISFSLQFMFPCCPVFHRNFRELKQIINEIYILNSPYDIR